MTRRLWRAVSLAAAGSAAVLSWGPGIGVTSAAASDGSTQQTLQRVASVDVGALPAAHLTSRGGKVLPGEDDAAAATSTPAPAPAPVGVTNSHRGVTGFSGLDAVTSGQLNGFDVEPPDQGLCAFHGVVMEQVNLAVQVFTDRGAALTHPVSLNSFFGQAPLYDPSTGKYGPFLSDPRCYYDWQTDRWYSTVLSIALDPTTGDFGTTSSLLIAVSDTSDPTGQFTIFSVDTTDNGDAQTPAHPDCPCFGDQPLLGADAHAIIVTTNEYSIAGTTQNNAQIYVASKWQLAALATGGTGSGQVVHLQAPTLQGSPSQSLQPATTPPGGQFAPNREYFLSANDFSGLAGGNTIVVWALSGTRTISRAHPSLSLTFDVMRSERYAGPVAAAQKHGPYPLGQSLDQPLPKLSGNDDRMQQVIYTRGLLTSALNTGIGGRSQPSRDGIAWFVVRPSFGSGAVSGHVVRQGYVTVAERSVLYPAIGLNADGTGAMVFTLAGEGYFPSAAYVPFTLSGTSGAVHVVGPGVAPEDGFTCYPPYSDGVCRWGDYSAAVAEDGAIMMATEYIPGPRDTNADWGTFIARYRV